MLKDRLKSYQIASVQRAMVPLYFILILIISYYFIRKHSWLTTSLGTSSLLTIIFFSAAPVVLLLFQKTESVNSDLKEVLEPKPYLYYMLFFFLTLSVRFPSFFASVINWDESTFALMGQDLLNGHLSYTHLWDMKPPFVFGIYAFFIAIFGKSIITIRLIGFLFVFTSACVIHKIGRELYDDSAGLWGGVLLIVFASVPPATMSEHLCLLPLSLLLYCFLLRRDSSFNTFTIGLIMGFLILIRTNLVYLGFMVGLIIFFDSVQVSVRSVIKNFILYILGGAFFVIILVFIYLLDNHLYSFIQATVTVPLAFVSLNSSTLIGRIMRTAAMLKMLFVAKDAFLWITFICGTIILLKKIYLSTNSRIHIIPLLLFIATLFSIVQTGRARPHYFVQLTLFMAYVGGIYFSKIVSLRNKSLTLFFVIILAIPLMPLLPNYSNIFTRLTHKKTLFSDTGYKVINYLNRQSVSGKYLFFADYHIGYWLTNSKIPTKYVHPSNIGREYLIKIVDGEGATADGELKKILAKQPAFIIIPDNVWYFSRQQIMILVDQFRKYYILVRKIDNIFIFKRESPKIEHHLQ